jgi:hypothetical protein
MPCACVLLCACTVWVGVTLCSALHVCGLSSKQNELLQGAVLSPLWLSINSRLNHNLSVHVHVHVHVHLPQNRQRH